MARGRELIELLCLLSLVAVFYFVLVPAGIIDPDGFVLERGLPPSFSARLVAILAATILLARMVRLLLARMSGSTREIQSEVQSETQSEILPEAQPVVLTPRVWGGVAIALIYAFLLVPKLGFVLASLLTLLSMLIVLGERSKQRLVLLPVLVTTGVWLLFARLLSVNLPAGTLLPLLTGN